MKVLPVATHNYVNNTQNIHKNPQLKTLSRSQIQSLGNYPKSYALSFAGGYSINLEETLDNFELAEEKTGRKVAPPRVEQAIINTVEMGNINGYTLIDVHKMAYQGIKDAQTLDEVRERYPEFVNVLDADQVDFKENKFVDSVRKGKHDIFNKDEDLALQLLKLYWAEGFSLGDIASYTQTNGATIASVMEKLNIPRVQPRYGIVLKLSDTEYNARLSATMADKMAEIHALREGLPLIPKKVTKEQKEKISEGLINYYANNPERVHEMAERQREFYKNHPEAALILRFVMFNAWNMESCAPIRKGFCEFLKQKRISENSLSFEDATSFTKRQSALMKEFWNINPHHRKKFAKAVERSWQKINNHKDIEIIRHTANESPFPAILDTKIKEWAYMNGYNIDTLKFSLGLQVLPQAFFNKTRENRVLNKFFNENPGEFNIFNNALSQHIFRICSYFQTKSPKSPVSEIVVKKVTDFLHSDKKIDVGNVLKLYAEILTLIKQNNLEEDYAEVIDGYEKSYISNAMQQSRRFNGAR